MSCLPGTPCYTSTIHTSGGIAGGCNLDPCNTMTLGTDAVFYIGPNLPCSGINPCDSVSLALQKIDAVICNPPALSVTANNGLTKTANNIQLGGPLVQQTVITTSFAYTLSLLGLSIDTNPAFILSQTSSGVIKKTTVATILSGISANNGLTITSGLIQLSGPLIKPTTVTTDPVNTLTLAGLQTDANPDFIVTETTGGVVRRISTSSLGALFGTPVTANNGLTKTGNNIQLGGALIIANTNIITNGVTNTLSITGLDEDKSPDFILTETSAGIVRKIETPDLGDLISNLITANNGITKSSNNIQLGGTLVKNTTVDTDIYSLALSSSDASKYCSATFNISANILQTGDDVTAVPTGSYTRTITFKSSAATWLTNYTSTAYNAQANWEAAHPWVVMDSAHNFQIVDYIHSVNKSSAFVARYYDERVNNSNWQDTWYNLVAYTADTGLSALKVGDYFTIADYDPADDFSASAASVYSGTINTTGCVFVSNGVAPIWTASRIDGDFPIIEADTSSSMVITDQDGGGIGRVMLRGENTYLQSTTTYVEGKLDQSTATRGFIPAQWTSITQPGSPDLGEMGFNTTLAQMEYWDGSTWIQF